MLRRVKIEFTGTSPLLMANPKGMTADDKPKVKTKRNKDKELALAEYRNSKGQLYFLPAAFRKALINGAKGRKVGSVGLPGILMGSVFDIGDEVVLVHPKTKKPLTDYAASEMRVVNKNAGALIAFRPQINDWQCEVEFEVDDDFVPDLSLLLDVFDIAGRTIGVGAFRPQKFGKYGRFSCRLVGRVADLG